MAAAATDDPADGALALRVYTSRLIGAEPEAAAQEIFSDRVALVPYVGPGFALVEAAADVFDAHPADEGPPIVNHGQLTFGETARGLCRRRLGRRRSGSRGMRVDGANADRTGSGPLTDTMIAERAARGVDEARCMPGGLPGREVEARHVGAPFAMLASPGAPPPMS